MEQRERVSAAVVLIIFLIGAIIAYLIIIPPPTSYSLVFGNFSSSSSSGSHTPPPVQQPGFFYNLTSYVGGNPISENLTYPVGTFGVFYNEANSTLSTQGSFSLTSSLIGSASYNVGVNTNTQDTYFLVMNISSVSGPPILKVALNGNYFYQEAPSSGVVVLKMPQANSGKNTISIYNDLNGFAFSQSIDFNSISVIQESPNNVSSVNQVVIPTFDGLGNFYVQYTPIGTGNLNVGLNGYTLSAAGQSNGTPMTIRVPPSVIDQMIPTGSSPILPMNFELGFIVSPNSRYEIANAAMVYQTPYLAQNNLTIPYTVQVSNSDYVLTLYVNSIIKSGNIDFTVYPSGATFNMSSSKLTTGENVLVLPYSDFAGSQSGNSYTGTITMTSDGLVIPEYVSLRSTP